MMQFNLKEVSTPTYVKPHQVQLSSSKGPKRNQKIVVVGSSGKGGTGKTTAAVNLALYYQECGQKTVLVDFDTPHGDVATMLGINDDKCLTNWLEIQRPLIPEYANNLLMTTDSGLKVLPSIRNARESDLVNSKRLANLIFASLSHFDVIIVDAAPHFGELSLEAYRIATDVLMVSDPTLVSLTNIYRGMKFLREQKIDTSKTTLMVNRITKKTKKEKTQYSRMTSIPDVIEVSYDPKIQDLMNRNKFPLIGKRTTKYAKVLAEWADDIIPNVLETPKKRMKFWG